MKGLFLVIKRNKLTTLELIIFIILMLFIQKKVLVIPILLPFLYLLNFDYFSKLKYAGLIKSLFRLTNFLVIVFVIKFFLVGLYYIPTNSMADTLKAGDFVLVNKLPAGIRTCRNLEEGCIITNKWGRIEPNDVIVFNGPVDYHKGVGGWSKHNVDLTRVSGHKYIPINKRTFYIKRCVAIPGDTLRIQNATVIRNSTSLNVPKEEKIHLVVHMNSDIKIDTLKTYKNLFWHVRVIDTLGSDIKLKMVTQFQHIAAIKRLTLFSYVDFLQVSDGTRRYEPLLINSWQFDSIPNIYVPKSGDLLVIDSTNFPLSIVRAGFARLQ